VARRLAQELYRINDGGVDALGIHDEHFDFDAPNWAPIRPVALSAKGPRSFGYSREFDAQIESIGPDVAHVHGLWTYPGIAARRWSEKSHGPFLVSVHGMLDDWALANSAWKKRLAGALFERANLRRATCLHAITAAEVDAIRRYGYRGPICLIPNGVDLPAEATLPPPAWRAPLGGRKVVLYLGRIHPKKGLAELIEGWAAAVSQNRSFSQDWALVIAGWDQGGFQAELQTQVAALHLQTDIIFVGPQFGADKAAAYAAASGFILPSFSEGLPLVVLEAWAHRLPVLMTPECALPIGFERDAAIRISPTPGSIAAGLLDLYARSESDRQRLGKAGRSLVESSFTWAAAGSSLCSVMGWLAGGGNRPGSVIG
jgi:poly(glycerol-phosphate) alpha-glucosyltransferase